MERADSAIVTARRAMTNGADASPAVQALMRAARDLAELQGIALSDTAPVAPPDAPAVTKPVTEGARESRRRKTADAPSLDAPTAGAGASERIELPPAIKPREIIDPGKVHMERIPSSRDDKRSKMVLVGHGDDARLVGFLEPHGIQQKKWDALAPGRTRLDGGPFRTRQEALVRLLYLHVSHKTRRARQRR